jgi:hypothetical protein
MSLTTSGTGSRTSLDQAQASVSQYQARIAQFNASEAASRLAGRDAEIEAARSKVTEAGMPTRREPNSPSFTQRRRNRRNTFEVGEWRAGQPVVSPGR